MSSSFLGKPKWWGVPVLVRSNLRLLGWFFAIVFGFASIAALATAGMNWDSPDKRLIAPLQAFVALSTVFILVAGWFLAAFFFLRALVSAVRMGFHRTEESKFFSIKAWYVPLYGWRTRDLSEEGLRLRRLAVEGLIGFLSVHALIWTMVFASWVVGIDFQAN